MTDVSGDGLERAIEALIAQVQRYDLMTNYRAGSSIEEMEKSDDGEWIRVDDVLAVLGRRSPQPAQEQPVQYVAWSKERGFYYSPDGWYVRRQDYESLASSRPTSVSPKDESPQDALLHPAHQVFFRAGLLACREYMARFVESQDPVIAMSIRANWWPSRIGRDNGSSISPIDDHSTEQLPTVVMPRG